MTWPWWVFLGIWVLVAVIVALYLSKRFKGDHLDEDPD